MAVVVSVAPTVVALRVLFVLLLVVVDSVVVRDFVVDSVVVLGVFDSVVVRDVVVDSVVVPGVVDPTVVPNFVESVVGRDVVDPAVVPNVVDSLVVLDVVGVKVLVVDDVDDELPGVVVGGKAAVMKSN